MSEVKIPIPAVPFAPPVYIVKRAAKDFVLDGNINKPFWENVPFTDEFLDIEGPHMKAPRFKTRAKMCWDDEYLYISAILYGTEIWATLTERDCVIFRDNDFEIFIDPDSDTQQYYEFEMNALNTVWDLLLTKAYRDNGKPVNCYDIHGLRTAVHIDGTLNSLSSENKSWSVEVVIPFSSICECTPASALPKPGDFYRMNFSRVQWTVKENGGKIEKLPLPEDNWVWAPTGVINIHYPELWSFVVFGNDDVTSFEIPECEKLKWELRKFYYAEHIYHDLNGSYTDSYDELIDILKKYSPIEANKTVLNKEYAIYVTPSFFEISCKSCDNRTVTIYADGRTSIN